MRVTANRLKHVQATPVPAAAQAVALGFRLRDLLPESGNLVVEFPDPLGFIAGPTSSEPHR